MGIANLTDFGLGRNPWTDLINPEKQPAARTILTKSSGKVQSYFIPAPETHQSQENVHLVIKEDDIDFSVDSTQRSFQFKRLKDGALAKEKDRDLIAYVRPNSSPTILNNALSDSPLCPSCNAIDLRLLQSPDHVLEHHKTFQELCLCASTCPLCALLMNSLSGHDDLTFDSLRPISMRATNDRGSPSYSRGMALNSLLIDFPTKESGYENHKAVRRSSLALTTNYSTQIIRKSVLRSNETTNKPPDSHAAYLGDITGRRVSASFNMNDMDAIFDWLSECFTRHPHCAQRAAQHADKDFAPTRLVDVGYSDTHLPRLVDWPTIEDESLAPPYLALSYQWGEAVSVTTKKSNLKAFQHSIKLEELCYVFRDAIDLTRKIGYRYIWIDALCIVQDCADDLARELKRMGHIYSNAALTLAASVSESGEARLLKDRNPVNEVMLPYSGCDLSPPCQVFVTDRRCTDFGQDVSNGNLSQRAWCLQERAMSRRILHLGKDQLFWECYTGIWAEGSSVRLGAKGKSLDEVSKFRSVFQSMNTDNKQIRHRPASRAAPPGLPNMEDRSRMHQIRERKPYGPWYSLVEQYTKRAMKYDSDKLPAIMGLARKFAESLSAKPLSEKEWDDLYTAGLWDKDLSAGGLLWSAGNFQQWNIQHVRSASTNRAPSWSWANVDGPVAWPDGFISSYKIQVSTGTYSSAHQTNTLGPRWTLGVLGHTLPLEQTEGFRRADRDFMAAERKRFAHLGPFRMPHAIFDTVVDAKIWDETLPHFDQSATALSRDQYVALYVAQIGCGKADCHHYANCEPNLGYALLLKPTKDGYYKRVGIAQVKSVQFLAEATEEYIEII